VSEGRSKDLRWGKERVFHIAPTSKAFFKSTGSYRRVILSFYDFQQSRIWRLKKALPCALLQIRRTLPAGELRGTASFGRSGSFSAVAALSVCWGFVALTRSKRRRVVWVFGDICVLLFSGYESPPEAFCYLFFTASMPGKDTQLSE